MLNDKNTIIFNLKYRKGFLILELGKGMEILNFFKTVPAKKIIKKQVDYFLFLFESLILNVEFGHVFLVMIVKLTWK